MASKEKHTEIRTASELEKEGDASQWEPYLKHYGMFDQLTLNNYAPGDGIPPHVDKHSPFQEIFMALSLKSGVTMHFKKGEVVKEGEESKSEAQRDIYLKPRSLILFSGEARYNWLHSIAQRKIDKVEEQSAISKESDCTMTKLRSRQRRVSLTFRKVKFDGPCRCPYPLLCDS